MALMKKYILFDLDGTLVDSSEGITSAVAYSLGRLGLEPLSKDRLLEFIGPPLEDTYMRFFGMTKPEAYHAIDVYREYYREKGIYQNRLYDGLKELLMRLKDEGAVPIVATSKPAVFSERILEALGISEYFTFVSGSELDGRRTDKAEVIAHAEATVGFDPSDAVMIGDKRYDMIGAHKRGMTAVGVLYGFGDREELESADADYIAADTSALAAILLGL